MTATELAGMRRNYSHGQLDLASLKKDPFEQFISWFEEARDAGGLEPNAMSLATASADGKPSLRTVLLKHFDERGFIFFTNLESKKAREIAENGHVALLFPWLALERQVIVSGEAERISMSDAAKYFLQRPVESQLSAWASPQSRVVESRQFILLKIDEMRQKFRDGKIPLPSFWGGYCVRPHEFEFWQGGQNRVHDRFQYSRHANGTWKIGRLAP